MRTIDPIIVSIADAERYQQAVADRLDAKMAVVAAWAQVHAYDDARTCAPYSARGDAKLHALRNAALECEGVYERALAREKEAADRVLKVVLHG